MKTPNCFTRIPGSHSMNELSGVSLSLSLTFAVVTGTHDHEDVFHDGDDGQRPEDER